MPTQCSIAICVPTYRRAALLQLLLEDISLQSVQPQAVIVVDGDPDSGEVQTMLVQANLPADWHIAYVPSNHGNLAYQRFLGWRFAVDFGADILVYLDDDQRIYQKDVLDWLTAPLLARHTNVVGVGCYSQVPSFGHDTVMNQLSRQRRAPWLARSLGSQATLNLKPGQLSPTGHRVKLVDNGQDYVVTEWLHGRVMAYRMSAISAETFSDDLFALDHVRACLGEDTFLSRRVGARGKLLYTFRAVVDHPNADAPKAYPHEVYGYAYAVTYSRRFLNDHYRVNAPPTISDRWALIKNYAGTVVLAWARWLSMPNRTNLAAARGTTLGAIHGLTRPPISSRLTPDINWWSDAEKALAATVAIRGCANGQDT